MRAAMLSAEQSDCSAEESLAAPAKCKLVVPCDTRRARVNSGPIIKSISEEGVLSKGRTFI